MVRTGISCRVDLQVGPTMANVGPTVLPTADSITAEGNYPGPQPSSLIGPGHSSRLYDRYRCKDTYEMDGALLNLCGEYHSQR